MTVAQNWLENQQSDAKAVAGYKAEWKKKGFPDVEPAMGPWSRRQSKACLNDPAYASPPEHTFWLAFLELLVVDIQGSNNWSRKKCTRTSHNHTNQQCAIEYLETAGFREICEWLNLEHEAVKRGLLAHRDEKAFGRRLRHIPKRDKWSCPN